MIPAEESIAVYKPPAYLGRWLFVIGEQIHATKIHAHLDRSVVIHSMQPAQSREIFWMVTGVFAFIIVAGISMVLTEFKFDFGVLRFISSYSGLIIFGTVFILALQWIDKRFIKGAAFN